MNAAAPLLVLVTPLVTDADSFRPLLEQACGSGGIASVILRLAPGDERTLINKVKVLAPVAQARDAALVVAIADGMSLSHDLATVAARGGADGIHVEDAGELRTLRERYRDGRIIGAGHLQSKHDAMNAGEVGADYVLFGEPAGDGAYPPLQAVIERAQWWAEIFETPCVAVAPSLEAVGVVAATGAEFVALADAVWGHSGGPDVAVRLARGVLERMEAGS